MSVSSATSIKPIVLIQLLQGYNRSDEEGKRTFKFVKNDLMKVHTETNEESSKRKSRLSDNTKRVAVNAVNEKLKEALSGRIGKVFVDKGMDKIAMPFKMAASNSGYGMLPTGSRVRIDCGKKIRAFTYWEKVNDIDLSAFIVEDDGRIEEASWRTYAKAPYLLYSGDTTNGYNGGSEYFDLDIGMIRKMRPSAKYVIFCNNIFSSSTFDECFCKAGFMDRDIIDSGEVYELTTVKTSYLVKGNSTMTCLFAIDLEAMEMIWINQNLNSLSHVAGENEIWPLVKDCISAVDVMNVGKFFRMAGEQVYTADEADFVVSFDDYEGKETIHPYDIEKLQKLME